MILSAAVSSMAHVLKCTVYLSNIQDFSKFNDVYSEWFSGDPPAREAVAVAKLPMNSKVEISIIAVLP